MPTAPPSGRRPLVVGRSRSVIVQDLGYRRRHLLLLSARPNASGQASFPGHLDPARKRRLDEFDQRFKDIGAAQTSQESRLSAVDYAWKSVKATSFYA